MTRAEREQVFKDVLNELSATRRLWFDVRDPKATQAARIAYARKLLDVAMTAVRKAAKR